MAQNLLISPRTSHLALFQPSPKRSSLHFISSPAAPLGNEGFVFAVTPTHHHLKADESSKQLEVGALCTVLPSAPNGSSFAISPVKVGSLLCLITCRPSPERSSPLSSLICSNKPWPLNPILTPS